MAFGNSGVITGQHDDTLNAGVGLCHRDAVELLVMEGPKRLADLVRLGVEFTRSDGKLDLGKEGGHSRNRIVHAHDRSGWEIERALLQQISSHPRISVYENHLAIDLITEHNLGVPLSRSTPIHCWGAYALDVTTNAVKTFLAPLTILCTGGAGQVYLHTTNPDIATVQTQNRVNISLPRLPPEVARRWPASRGLERSGTAASLSDLAIDHGVAPAPIRGGAVAARAALLTFVREKLDRYAEERNDPDADVTCGLSPYLHFGHLSAHEVFRTVAEDQGWELGPVGRESGLVGGDIPAQVANQNSKDDSNSHQPGHRDKVTDIIDAANGIPKEAEQPLLDLVQ